MAVNRQRFIGGCLIKGITGIARERYPLCLNRNANGGRKFWVNAVRNVECEAIATRYLSASVGKAAICINFGIT